MDTELLESLLKEINDLKLRVTELESDIVTIKESDINNKKRNKKSIDDILNPSNWRSS